MFYHRQTKPFCRGDVKSLLMLDFVGCWSMDHECQLCTQCVHTHRGTHSHRFMTVYFHRDLAFPGQPYYLFLFNYSK